MSEDQEGDERRRRAEARRHVATLRRTELGAPDIDEEPILGEEAIALATELSNASWALTGRAIPTYSRAQTPIRFVRLGSP